MTGGKHELGMGRTSLALYFLNFESWEKNSCPLSDFWGALDNLRMFLTSTLGSLEVGAMQVTDCFICFLTNVLWVVGQTKTTSQQWHFLYRKLFHLPHSSHASPLTEGKLYGAMASGRPLLIVQCSHISNMVTPSVKWSITGIFLKSNYFCIRIP